MRNSLRAFATRHLRRRPPAPFRRGASLGTSMSQAPPRCCGALLQNLSATNMLSVGFMLLVLAAAGEVTTFVADKAVVGRPDTHMISRVNPITDSSLKCNRNGVIAGASGGGRCRCDAAWRGGTCSELAFLPAAGSTLGTIYPGRNSNTTSSWGGTLTHGADGMWHLLVSEVSLGCGLGSWQRNSLIRHAISSRIDGVFEPQVRATPTSRSSRPAIPFFGSSRNFSRPASLTCAQSEFAIQP
jgi:hypothetical protein